MKGEYILVKVEENEIKITNPQKILFPRLQLTKLDFIKHLITLGPYLLRYTENRFLTMIRYPHGVGGESFYQKNVPKNAPSFVHTQIHGKTNYILLNNLSTLVWLANLGCLEFHASFHSIFSLHPTELVFDIDPTVANFSQVMEVALYTRGALNQIGLDSFVKTSGATGLQIYVPIQPLYRFEETRKVSFFLATYLQEKYPALITIERVIKNRGTKVYFDYLQHGYQKTLISPYSPRATDLATVSTPLQWEEIKEGVLPEDFTLQTITNRLKQIGDPFSVIYDATNRYSLNEILSFLR